MEQGYVFNNLIKGLDMSFKDFKTIQVKKEDGDDVYITSYRDDGINYYVGKKVTHGVDNKFIPFDDMDSSQISEWEHNTMLKLPIHTNKLNNMIQSPKDNGMITKEMIDYIKLELGSPVINVELTDEMIEQQIVNAIDTVKSYHSHMNEYDYARMFRKQTVKNLAVAMCKRQWGFILSKYSFEVTNSTINHELIYNRGVCDIDKIVSTFKR